MTTPIEMLFPSYLAQGQLGVPRGFNQELAREIAALETIDDHGRAWSAEHYRNGYSSYSSLCNLHQTSPNFSELEVMLRPHVRRFVKKLNWDLGRRRILMTTCWANRMNEGAYHTMHAHPSSVLSGVYYVETPPGASPLKIEDPRLGLMMAAPGRKASAPAREQNYLRLPAKAGNFVLFESWLRHEVPPHPVAKPRLSVSFNYEWL